MATQIFQERLDLSESQLDADNRVLRNVVLIRAGMSANRKHYPETVLQASAPIFNGVKAYDSHKRGARSVAELTGWYANVRYVEGKLIADRHFTSTDAGRNVMSVAQDIVEGRAPASLAGLSINAVGHAKQQKFDDGDGYYVESITGVTSVDDVDSPAAGGSYLLASGSGDDLTVQVLQSMTFEEWFQSRPEFVERVQKEMKTIRQDDAVKAALAAKDAALAEADHHRQALQEAQTQIEVLMQEREAAVVERDAARRELAIETALSTARLPASWKNGLRESLLKARPDEWQGILEREVEKSKVQPQRPSVTGAGAQQNVPQQMQEAFDPRPRDGEDSESWARRIASYRR
jgi:hypothetical protein